MKTDDYLKYLFWYSFLSFLIFATWEWIQTPFFIDITDDINTIVWYRIHCTLGDMMILISCMAGSSLIFRKISWIFHPERKHYIVTTVLGVCYTLFSEFRNVHLEGNWGYSQYMPEIFGIGLVPLIQWILLPALILYMTKRVLGARISASDNE